LATNNYIVRAVDSNNNWLFGSGLNNYAANNAAVALDIQMNLQSFLGDCFFALDNGIDWFNLLGGKNQTAIALAVNAALLGTQGVTGIIQTSISLNDSSRSLTINYQVQTVYSQLQSSFVFDLGLAE
jgi:hypothetical protein